VPLFKILAKHCNLKVFYTWGEKGAGAKYDPDFKKVISWDLPLLANYDYEFLINSAKDPGSHHYRGIVNPDLAKKITAFHPDAILVYGWAYQSHLSAMRYFKGKIPIWFRGDSTLIDEQKGFKGLFRRSFLRWVYKHGDLAFFVGTANKAYFKKFGLKENQLVFAPHAIDNDRFAINRKAEVDLLRKKLNVIADDILILFAGKLEAKKNPELLLNAFKALKLKKIHLLFVGNGELEAILKSKAKTADKTTLTTTNLHFIDFQNQTQMPLIYQACDLFCLPSQGPGETWGLAVNEAMAASKAILISNKVGCAADLVKNGVNGYIFESNNGKDLNDKLNLLVKNKTVLANMGKKSSGIIKNWRIEIQAAAILKELNN